MERDPHLVSEIGQAARAAFGEVFEGWNSEVDWPINRAVEAQIAAASLGHKPLYWDPWGEAFASLRSQLRSKLRTGAIIGAVPVRIFNDEAALFAFFMSDPDAAEFHARERLLDIATYIEADLSFSIGPAE